MHAIVVTVGNGVSSVQSVPACYNQVSWSNKFRTRVEAGSNSFTVTLRVVGGDEKGSLKYE
jgi:hypothetical protein